MDKQQRLAVFEAQTQNVRELENAWSHINRQINSLILQKNQKGVEVNTKVLTLIYCALAEALFSKLVHTPYGLPLDEVEQVKVTQNESGVKNAWLKCAELGMQRVQGAKNSHNQNVRKKLTELINRQIFDPSLLRNKLAHGQWRVALNRENTAVNSEITKEIESHNVVELYRRKYALEKLALILEDIIESPNKAHHRDYWAHLVELETEQREQEQWTFERKVEQLSLKKSRADRK